MGKTTLCKLVCEELSVKYITASELIGQMIANTKDTKKVENISENQDILLRALDQEIPTNGNYLLDGHFCLLNSTGAVEKVPLHTFRGIAPCAVIILYDRPDIICERLKNRDGQVYNRNALEAFQDQEIMNAQYVCHELKIPLLKCEPAWGQGKIVEFIRSVI